MACRFLPSLMLILIKKGEDGNLKSSQDIATQMNRLMKVNADTFKVTVWTAAKRSEAKEARPGDVIPFDEDFTDF